MRCGRNRKSMNLQEKAITETEAERRGAVPFSFPCRLDTECWILENMVEDFKRAGWDYCIIRKDVKVHSQNGSWQKPALELWKIS